MSLRHNFPINRSAFLRSSSSFLPLNKLNLYLTLPLLLVRNSTALCLNSLEQPANAQSKVTCHLVNATW